MLKFIAITQFLFNMIIFSYGLECIGGHITVPFNEPNYCAYYHTYRNDRCGNSIHGKGRVFSIDNELNDRCGPIKEKDSTTIFCLCNTDNCNNDEHVMEMLMKEDTMEEIKMLGMDSKPHENQAIELFLCMKRELGFSAIREGEKIIVKTDKTWLWIGMVIEISCIAAVIISSVLYLINRRKILQGNIEKEEETQSSPESPSRYFASGDNLMSTSDLSLSNA
ncbi:hypothetical protein DICVIV_05680 [Dictyocaulus viviparus]|uniref:Activin types I and II receptor domain protein n=1 Tax=Dictyocaulus viviparus TaxID=29172 RepID=A0A0D8Y0U4_DICVI|nr:hypothetical protein DICVIV_05680 [Dictyocaulus viviparus]